MVAHPLAPVRGSDRLVVATSQTCATKPRRPPPCRSRPRASAAPLSVVRPFALASNESSDTCVLPFTSQINHALSTPTHNRPFEAEVIFCVQGAISPLLSNLMLDVLDKELEKRGHRFVRYADDCNIYVRSQKAGERVMAGIERFLEKRLKLKVNKAKSAVAKPSVRKFLGFSFTFGSEPRRRIAPQAITRFKARVRELTRRSCGRSLARIVKELSVYLIGWRGYFGFCQTPSVLRKLDEWLRRRLRAIAWKQWKHGRARFAELRRRGVGRELAAQTAGSPHGPWRLSNSPALSLSLPNACFRSLGLTFVAELRHA